jgi:hypothetical protein
VTAELATVRSVIAYAAQLRARAATARVEGDPYVEPYSPSEASARKVYQAEAALSRRLDSAARANEDYVPRSIEELQDEAAKRAINILAGRVAMHERETRQHREQAERAERRHARRQRVDRAEMQAALAQLSLGKRLDDVLRELNNLSEAPTWDWQADRISGSPERSTPPASPLPPDRYSRLRDDARDLVFRLEEELSHVRRREIREEGLHAH